MNSKILTMIGAMASSIGTIQALDVPTRKEQVPHVPVWKSKNGAYTRGKRSKSLRERANRRKARAKR